MLTAVAVTAALALALLPLPSATVERYYSAWFYPAVQRVVTPLSNLVPFALFDLLIGGAVLWLLLSAFRDGRQRRSRGAMRTLLALISRTALVCAFLYLFFLIAWGLNYRRVPLHAKVAFDASAATAVRARALAQTAVERLNGLHLQAHAAMAGAGDEDPELARGFARTLVDLGIAEPVPRGRPKRSLIDPYFRAAGVDGMTDPFFLETLVASGPLPIERPFVIAHEWSHLAGFADEGEANFIGWLTAVRSGPAAQYSGWLFLYAQLSGSLDRTAREESRQRLQQGPREDLRAIAERYRAQVRPQVSAAGWQVYDRYLKANRVEAGVASYAEVVRFVLGTQFTGDWTPVMAGHRPPQVPPGRSPE